jgi:hypothetical protein
MRERAQAATPSADPKPGGWHGFSQSDDTGRAFIYGGPAEDGYRTGTVFDFKEYLDCEECVRPSQSDVAHIASWHPAVALAVADWLEADADRRSTRVVGYVPASEALAVARAYLGGEQS